MLKTLLPLLLILTITQTHAQKIISVDSVALFRIGQDMNNSSRGLLQNKGTVTEVKPDSAGNFAISVFKQHNGVLILDPSVKRKGLVSGSAVLPGLAQYTYGPEGIKLIKEKTFSLNTGLIAPFKYKFTEANGALNKSQAASVEKILGSDELGGDYNRLREMAPGAVNYRGDVIYYKNINLDKNLKTVYTRTPVQYVPFMAGYDELETGPAVTRSFDIKTNPKGVTAYRYGKETKLIFLGPPVDERVSVISIDTLGKQTVMAEIPIKKGMEIIATGSVNHQSKNTWISNHEATAMKGMDLLMAISEKKKVSDYTFVRLDEQGKLLYQHPVNMELEDYVYDHAKIHSNETESIVEFTLRKSLIKYAVFMVKINAGGVVYSTRREFKMSDKGVTADGRATMGGSNKNERLISLPDGENLIWGYMTDMTEAKSGQLINYGGSHLDKDGNFKAYYNAKAQVPPQQLQSRPFMSHTVLADGRVVIVVNEPRNNAGAVFQQFGLLDMEMCKECGVKANELEPGTKSIFFNERRFARAKPAPASTGIKLLDKLDKIAAATNGPVDSGKKTYQLEDDPVGYVPSVLVIDTKNEKIRQTDFMRSGGYSLSNKPQVWVNPVSGEAVAVLRTLPISQDSKRGGYPYPMDVYLKIIKMKL